MRLSRRKYIALMGLIAAGAMTGGWYATINLRRSIPPLKQVESKTKVFMVSVKDSEEGIKRLIEQFPLEEFDDETVALKANFNSADPFPGSTPVESLRSLIEDMQQVGVSEISLVERSGIGSTRKVLESKGVFDLSKKLGFNIVNLDELDKPEWVHIPPEGTHWLRGFPLPRVILEADRVVQICCLKTHRFGGHFTMSLKNSVGLVAKRIKGELYDYMMELHTSPYQRHMIAEINRFYPVDLVIMDALKAFVKGGPDKGETVEPGLMLAGRDRVAVDAVGVAILRLFGSTKEVMDGEVFELEQIRRAAELGVGINSPEKIELVPLNEPGVEWAEKIEPILKAKG